MSPKINPHICGQSVSGTKYNGERIFLSTTMLEQLDTHMQMDKVRLLPYAIQKIIKLKTDQRPIHKI